MKLLLLPLWGGGAEYPPPRHSFPHSEAMASRFVIFFLLLLPTFSRWLGALTFLRRVHEEKEEDSR
jgi:hypothetical protein